MKVAKIKTQKQFESVNWQGYDIQTYGETNDFPQAVHEIVKSSKTGTSCLDIYNDFVYGHGFRHEGVSKMIVNRKRNRLDKILRKVTKDFTEYFGVTIHINYNMNFQIRSIDHIPFEDCRLSTAQKGWVSKICVHPDWGRRKNKFKWIGEDIERFDVFNPDPAVIAAQVEEAGGWDKYKGQIYYYSGEHDGDIAYPTPKYIAEVTDMRTEEGLANVTGRNVCSNFMLAGMLIEIFEGADQNEKQVQEKHLELARFQGDENALQLWYGTAKNKDEVPVFVPFQGNNYDKAFTVTQAYVPDSIGQIFKQPPILRAKDVAGNLGAELLTNAYKFYNTITVRERQQLSEIFAEIFSYWWAPLEDPDFDIMPLVYNAGASIREKVGDTAMAQINAIVSSAEYTLIQKRNLLKVGYGIDDREAILLCPNDEEASGRVEINEVGKLQALFEILSSDQSPEEKSTTLQIVFGYSEDDANKLANVQLNIDLNNDTETGGLEENTSNSREFARFFKALNVFRRSRKLKAC